MTTCLRIWVVLIATLLCLHASAGVVLRMDEPAYRNALRNEGVTPAFIDAVRQAVARLSGRELSGGDRRLVGRVSVDANRCTDGAVWIGQLSSRDAVDAVVMCNALGFSLHFGDGRPTLWTSTAVQSPCERAELQGCPVEVVRTVNAISGVEDIYARLGGSCHLFVLGPPGSQMAGAWPCEDGIAKAVARREACSADKGWLAYATSPVQRLVCLRPTSDSGKLCNDNRQCEGQCAASGIAATSGLCSATRGADECGLTMYAGKARMCGSTY